MRRLLSTIGTAIFAALAPPPASATPEALGLALDALAQGDLTLAAEATGAIDDPIALDVVEWTRLRRGGAAFDDYIAFLDRNADWPGLPYLRTRGESSIPVGAEPTQVIAYFEPQLPQTGGGALALARALSAQGDTDAAEAEAIRAWTTLTLSSGTAGDLRAAFGDVLNSGDLHIRRLDHLLWEGAEDRARAMYPLVPDAWRALADARLALRERRPGVDDLIEAVPADLSDHPGLAFERFLWRVRSGFWDTAGALMLEYSTSAEALGRPAAWADRRADLARDVAREGQFGLCYDYAANHFVARDDDYLAFADLEWIAGYCALRDGRPDIAVGHFEAFRDTVFSPISAGRAGYWLGRAHEARGDAEAAGLAYALGARNQSSFYGQLAAERGGLPVDPAFLADTDYGDWRAADFTNSTVFHAALLLYEAGQRNLAERFLTHLTESLTRDEAGMLGDFALDLGDPHLALKIAKRAAQSGFEIMRAYYPIADLEGVDLPAPQAFALSIARRESEFDPDVVSFAGAIGLMQVMPGTGADTARLLGLPFSEARLRTDPAYNVLLGSTYIAGLIDSYGGNPVLVSAGYNAGPGRANQWIERFGDPRGLDQDAIVDWIEAIPFTETRNYIMRVTESLPIYEAQLTGVLPTLGLSERLAR
ncbi:Soluble lytic murein transglycosylase precursor [Roseibacterium elongatum DSM 19469]|uniref:Soluble lytic murein transglycosylase n=1 Tax=Roseicyclus elongatus DSM 19469 TaxID=1294273 RepID=W8S4B9_9RHOB|nr:lytic transglycosylase domain-containing protein [Roseibacterium elongatum]AHM03636.1 Soluble lytic murein transglycosylase precursor [Roseibacterium elongatum DSM 19469]